MCPSAPRVCSEPGGQKPELSLSLDLIGSHLSREPTTSPVLTKWWNWELTLATNFGSHAQMVTCTCGISRLAWIFLSQVHNKHHDDIRDQPRYAPSQWETSLQCNDVSHWLGAYLDWSLWYHLDQCRYIHSLCFGKTMSGWSYHTWFESRTSGPNGRIYKAIETCKVETPKMIMKWQKKYPDQSSYTEDWSGYFSVASWDFWGPNHVLYSYRDIRYSEDRMIYSL